MRPSLFLLYATSAAAGLSVGAVLAGSGSGTSATVTMGAANAAAISGPVSFPPMRIQYTGKFFDNTGAAPHAPVPDSTTNTIVFEIFDSPTGGNSLYGPETQSVSTKEGVVSAVIGSSTPMTPAQALAIAQAGRAYLQITFDSQGAGVGLPAETFARVELTSSAFAIHAAYASDVPGANITPKSVDTTGAGTGANSVRTGNLEVTGASSLGATTVTNLNVTGTTVFAGDFTFVNSPVFQTGFTVGGVKIGAASTAAPGTSDTADATQILDFTVGPAAVSISDATAANNVLTIGDANDRVIIGDAANTRFIVDTQNNDVSMTVTDDANFTVGDDFVISAADLRLQSTNGISVENVVLNAFGQLNLSDNDGINITTTGSSLTVDGTVLDVRSTNGIANGGASNSGRVHFEDAQGTEVNGPFFVINGNNSDFQGAIINSNAGFDAGRVQVNDALHVTGALTVDGATTQTGLVTFTGNPAVDIQGNIVNSSGVNGGVVAVNDDFTVSTGTTNVQAFIVNGTTVLIGTLDARAAISNSTGNLNLNDSVDISGPTNINNTLNVTGATIFQSTVDAQGAVSNSTGDLNLNDDVNVTGGLDVTGNLDVNGTGDVQGAMILQSTLDARGAVSNSTGNLNLNDNVDITGNLDVNGNADVSGATILQGTLDAQGAVSNSTGDLNLNDNVDVTGNLDVTGNFVVAGTVEFSNNSDTAVEVNGGIFNGSTVTGAGNAGDDPVQVNDALWVRGRMLVHSTTGNFASYSFPTSDAFTPLPANQAAVAMAVDGSVQIGTLGGVSPGGLTVEGTSVFSGGGGNPAVIATNFINAQGGIENSGAPDLLLNDNTDIAGTLDVTGSTTVGGNLTVTGTTNTGPLQTTTILATGLITGQAGLTITGATQLNGALTQTGGAISFTGAQIQTGAFTQSAGAVSLGGATTVNNTLTVGAFLTSLGGNLDVAGAISTPGGAALQINDDLQVNGTSDLRGLIQNLGALNGGRVFVDDVNGFATAATTPSLFQAAVTVGAVGTPVTTTLNGALTVGNNAAQFANSTFNGSVTVTGDTGAIGGVSQFIVGSLAGTPANVPSTFNGNVNLNQVVVIGDNTNSPVTDSLTVNSDVVTIGNAGTDTMTVNSSTTFANGATLTVNSDVATIGNAATDTLGINSATTFADTAVLVVNSNSATIGNAGTDALGINSSTTFSNGATLVVSSNTATIGDNAGDILTVNSTTTFANNVIINGDLTENGGAGALTVNGDASVTGNTIIGDAAGDSLTVNATSLFNAPITTADAANLTLNSNVVNAMDDAGDVWNFNNGTTTFADGTTLTVNSTTTTIGNAGTDALNINASTTLSDGATLVVNSNSATIGNAGTDALIVNSSTTFTDGATLVVNSNSTTVGNVAGDALVVNATSTFNAPITTADAATLTLNSNIVNAMDDAGDVWNFNAGTTTFADDTTLTVNSTTTTLGNAAGDSLTVNATSLFNSPSTFADAATLTINSNTMTVGNSSGDALNVNSSTTFSNGATIVANSDSITLGNSSGDSLVVNSTSTFNANVTANQNLTVNGNTTLGNASGDTLTVNATSTFNANLSSLANTTIGNSPTDVLQVNAGSAFGNNGTGFGAGNLLPGSVMSVWGNTSFAGTMALRRASNGAQTITFDGETGKITAQQLQVTGQKNFVAPHPTDATKQVVFNATESDEYTVFTRGTRQIKKGNNRIELSENFGLTAETDGVTATVTPVGKKASVWIVEETREYIVVAADEDVKVNFRVEGVRRGFKNLNAIEKNTLFLPKTVEQVKQLVPGVREVLMQNGIVNADGTPNLDLINQIEASR